MSVAVAAATAITMFSCADKKDESYNVQEQRLIDSWVAQNINDTAAVKAVKQDNGMYIQWMSHGNTSSPLVSAEQWVRINYRALTLTQDLFLSRDVADAKKIGFFSAYTDYSPQFVQYFEGMSIPLGMYQALGQMHVGAKVRLILPARLASIGYTSMLATNGYGVGESYSAAPVIVEMELAEIVPDALAADMALVTQYASSNGFTELQQQDGRCVYYKILSNAGANQIPKAPAEDMSLKIHFETRMLNNNALVGTNVGSVGFAAGRDTTSYDYLYFDFVNGATSSLTTEIEWKYFTTTASKLMFETVDLNDNCEFEMVISSNYIFGSEGYTYETTPCTVVQPYTPMHVKIKVTPNE